MKFMEQHQLTLRSKSDISGPSFSQQDSRKLRGVTFPRRRGAGDEDSGGEGNYPLTMADDLKHVMDRVKKLRSTTLPSPSHRRMKFATFRRSRDGASSDEVGLPPPSAQSRVVRHYPARKAFHRLAPRVESKAQGSVSRDSAAGAGGKGTALSRWRVRYTALQSVGRLCLECGRPENLNLRRNRLRLVHSTRGRR